MDFDVHHGNGTYDVFERDPDVLVIDIHEETAVYVDYPSSEKDQGKGPGTGATINIPLPSKKSGLHHRYDDSSIPHSSDERAWRPVALAQPRNT